jgi:hypothetical protein
MKPTCATDITSYFDYFMRNWADRQIDNTGRGLEVGVVYLLLTIYLQFLKRRHDTTYCTTLFKSL